MSRKKANVERDTVLTFPEKLGSFDIKMLKDPDI